MPEKQPYHSQLDPEEPDMSKHVPLSVLKRLPHNVIGDEEDSLVVWGSQDLGTILPLLDKISARHELVVRLHLGIDFPPMGRDRLREVLPRTRKSVEDLLTDSISIRKETDHGPQGGRSRAGGLTFGEVSSILGVHPSRAAVLFEEATRKIRWQRNHPQEPAEE